MKIVEGNDNVDENQFVDEIVNSQKDPRTRIELRSHRERPEEKKSVDLMIIDKEDEEESTRDALIRRKRKEDFKAIVEEVHASLKKFVPLMVDKTLNDIMKKKLPKIIANRIRLERQKVQNDLATLVADVNSFLQNYMSHHILDVHPTANAISSIPDLQHQLYLKMKDNERAHDADLVIWLSLKIKFEKPVPLVKPYRVVVRTHDHEDHHDDDARLKGESSAKIQKTFKHGTFTTHE
uniref:Uncharacterized protein n=1 Tax=Tanacetum cinerariifolium TaxID=118510 RepID=A0A699HAE1_TANCI|nr:hypothetical protein [Tanacetum cinerariifolium]